MSDCTADRNAAMCRAHFIDGISLSALADRHCLTFERIETITQPVRVLLDNPQMRDVLAEALAAPRRWPRR